MFEFPDDFKWLFPWRPLNSDYAIVGGNLFEEPKRGDLGQLLADELHHEMVEGRELFGETVRGVAVYVLTHQDFVFTSTNPAKPISVVHLTWSKEKDPIWPRTEIHPSLDDWVKKMQSEHDKCKHLQERFEKAEKRASEN